MKQGNDDFHVRNFARVLATLEPHLPISDQYELDCPQRQGVWWSSQQEQMVRCFSEKVTRGYGAFTRAEPNTSTRTTYNRLLAPAELVWMAESLEGSLLWCRRRQTPHTLNRTLDGATEPAPQPRRPRTRTRSRRCGAGGPAGSRA